MNENVVLEDAFEGFPSLHRYTKEKVVVTEKIDGTNAQIFINDTGTVLRAGSRNKWITPSDDNYGFAKWVQQHREFLLKFLGPGRHFGEWWGLGVQRGYGLKEKRFSLFNVGRWSEALEQMKAGNVEIPQGLGTVPLLGVVNATDYSPDKFMTKLLSDGSAAVPGWKTPEGIVSYHTLSKVSYKTTFEGDKHKWELKNEQERSNQ